MAATSGDVAAWGDGLLLATIARMLRWRRRRLLDSPPFVVLGKLRFQHLFHLLPAGTFHIYYT